MNQRDYSFKTFEAVLTYAVDEANEVNEHSILNDLDFNEDTFFEKVYFSRKDKEEELEKELRKNQSQILLLGHPGTGKTTLLRRVLRKLQEEEDAYIIFIDCKTLKGINDSKNAIHEELSKFIERALITAITTPIKTRNVITDFLVTQTEYVEDSKFFNNPEFIEILNRLKDIHNFKNDGIPDFLEWFKAQRTRIKSDRFEKHFLNLSDSLKAHNCLYYMAFANNKSKQRLCIICFDNVDSIVDNSVRDTFCKYFRQYQGIYKNAGKVLLSMRSNNPALKNLPDKKSYIITIVETSYNEFIAPDHLDRLIKAHDASYGSTDYESKEHIKSKLIRESAETFAKSIYEKRINYVKEKVDEKTKERLEAQNSEDTIDLMNFEKIQKIFHLLLGDSRLRIAFLDLCNYDRREMLVSMNAFVSHLIHDVSLDIEDLELDKNTKFKTSTIQFILESYFYGWINTSSRFYENEVYNLPRDVSEWIDGIHDEIGCNLDHLIFAAIYNLSNQILNKFSYDKFTTIGEIVKNLEHIGYSRDVILEKIFYLYRTADGDNKGLLELSRFLEIESPDKFKDTDKIGLTPKSFYLTSYSNLKFISIISSIRSNEIKKANKEFHYDDKNPINPRTIKGSLRFLCGIAEMHLDGLFRAKMKLQTQYKNWFLYYRMIFCIRPNTDIDKNGDLLFNNLINSCIKFLEQQKPIEDKLKRHSISDKMIAEFEKLKDLFNKALGEMIENKYQSIEDVKKITFCDKLSFDVFIEKSLHNTFANFGRNQKKELLKTKGLKN